MPDPAADAPTIERRRWMAVLARASAADIEERLAGCEKLPAHVRLRGPESGLVMLRGRVGGGGGAFNLGEMTVTRCTVRLEGGAVGHAYVAGRDHRQAELAALLDAALQDPGRRPTLTETVITPLVQAQQARRAQDAARAAATRVEFFTMATMRT